jgi:hypothetical protein
MPNSLAGQFIQPLAPSQPSFPAKDARAGDLDPDQGGA